MTIQVAQIRIVPVKGDLRANHETLMSVLGEIGPRAADVVVTPECFLDGYVSTEEGVNADNIREYAVDPSDSPMVATVAGWAKENSTWVVLGCARVAPEGVYNSALVIDRNGELRGVYDKTHLQVHDKKYLPGQNIPVFDSDFGLFGVLICADRRWPETVRTLALGGARVIFNPTLGMHDDRNRHMMQTRSYESEVFIAFTHPLQSLLTGPEGEIVVDEADGNAHFTLSRIDLSEVDRVRSGESAHLRDRRPELYIH